jgi:single-strand DNA-binding protein
MNETMMTIVGNVVDAPRRRETSNGHAVTNFRIASTTRRYDREQEKFVDSSTLYITVTCWRGLAENVDRSLRKGHPVVVHGRYYMREYKVDEQLRTSYELEAVAVGHDLSRGTAEFNRVYRSPPVTVARDEQGIPVDDSDHWVDPGTEVDVQPGREAVPADARTLTAGLTPAP